MAYYVAKTLNIRPNEILDHWGVPELLVTYGQYANEEVYSRYQEWKSLSVTEKNKIPKPPKYAVYFYDVSELED